MKHLLYFAGYRMTIFRWENGSFTGMAEFEPDDLGFENFEKLLSHEVKQPVRMLIDIIEEDFRIDSIPSVYGSDKTAVRDRVIKKHFRKYPYTNLQTQGREASGRRDEIALISALTNFELFRPWLTILDNLKIPMEGIYTLPLVGEQLINKLEVKSQRVLIISQQVPSSIRESFYQDGKLKLSRLAPSVDDANKRYKVLREETERTIKFLENQRYVNRDSALDVYIIAHGAEHETLARVMVDDQRSHYHFIDKDILASRLGIKNLTPGTYCDWIYAHLLLSNKRIKPHYGTVKEKKYYYHYLANKVMGWGATAIFVVSLLLSGFAWLNIQNLSQQKPNLKAETAKYDALFQETISQISNLQLDVQDVREAVDIIDNIKTKYGHLPLQMMSELSQQLNQQPKVSIDRLQWVATYDPDHSLGEVKEVESNTRNARRRGRGKVNNQNALYEKILLDATVIDFENNPRIAIERVTDFVDALKASGMSNDISILKMPFDIGPDSRFTRNARVSGRGTDKDAQFTILLIKEGKTP